MELTDRLDLFVRRAEELLARRAAREGLQVSFTIKATVGGPVELESTEPDEEDLRSFLMAFRKFILRREPTYLPRVRHLLKEAIEDDELQVRLDDIGRRWEQAKKSIGLNFVNNGEIVTPETMLEWWIYGEYFHDDDEKAAALGALDPCRAF